jgi:tetratricopeptide (TPR) repeat protein
MITAHSAVLLYAQSGAGKTSLINAGLIPLLKARGFEVLATVRGRSVIPPTIPAEDIDNIHAFNTILTWDAEQADPKSLIKTTLEEYLGLRPHNIDDASTPSPRIAIFDQFEELFTAQQEYWKHRDGFFQQLSNALDKDPLLRILFAIREDHLADLDPYAGLLPESLRTRFRLECLTRDEALAAIQGPLQPTNRRFAEGSAERLVDELLQMRVETSTGKTIWIEGAFVEPVQLQVVCYNLWKNLPPDVDVISSDFTLESVNNALTLFYEDAIQEAVKTLTKTIDIHENDIRQWCEEFLITSTGTRGMVHRGSETTERLPNVAIEILEKRHLIRPEWHAGAHWYELTHDRFIEPILASNKKWEEEYTKKSEQALSLIQRATVYLGKTTPRKKDYEKAIESFRSGLEIAKEVGNWDLLALILINLGQIFLDQERNEDALQSFDGVLRLQPENVLALYYRGVTLNELKRYDDALESLDYALYLQPDPETEFVFGQTLSKLERYHEANETFDKVLAQQPENVDAWYEKAWALYYLGLHEEELQSWHALLDLDPEHPDTLYNIACCYAEKGEVEEAMEYLRRAIYNSKDPELREKAKTDSDFDRIRNDPNFRELVYREDKSHLH